MKTLKRLNPFLLALSGIFLASFATAEPFTFQGYLERNGAALNGAPNLQFRVFSQEQGGSSLSNTLMAPGYPLADGLLTIDLDFAGLDFDGTPRWLEVEVDGEVLEPRIPLQAAPFSSSTNALRGRPVASAAPIAGQVLGWDGNRWIPTDAPAGTTYTAGTGISLDGDTISIQPALRLPGGCSPGQVPAATGTDAWDCSGPFAYIPGAGLDLVGQVFSIGPSFRMPQGCADNQVPKWNGVEWQCAADENDAVQYSAGPGLTRNGSEFSVNFSGSGSSNTASRGDHNHWGGSWVGSSPQAGLSLENFGSGFGLSATGRSAQGAGIWASNTEADGRAIVAMAYGNSATATALWGSATQGGRGVFGSSTTGDGVAGSSDGGRGVFGTSSGSAGVEGISSSGSAAGVFGFNLSLGSPAYGGYFANGAPSGVANMGYADGRENSVGVVGLSAGRGSEAAGVIARLADNASAGAALRAASESLQGAGAFISNAPGDTAVLLASGGAAIQSIGNTLFSGNMQIFGTLSANAKNFRIDHPLRPDDYYLVHTSIESSERVNIYSGNAVSGSDARAVVELPDWFEALNGDFRYQLTVIGSFAQAIVEEEMKGNRFTIRTSHPGVKVSWQVTGVRRDTWAVENPLAVEVAKDELGLEEGLKSLRSRSESVSQASFPSPIELKDRGR